MLDWIKKHYKKLILIFGLLTTLVIMILVAWIFQLNQQVIESLKAKKFLPPTQYFSAPKTFLVGSPISQSEFETWLINFKYTYKDQPDRLRKGEYTKLTAEQCLQFTGDSSLKESSGCLVYNLKENNDPELKQQGVFVGAWDKSILLAAFAGNPAQKAVGLYLEPRLIAQYLEKEPIQQNYTPLGEIPVSCLNAVLAIEDRNYLEHSGVSPMGMMRALLRNLLKGRMAQGGSTITQQMVKNYFLTSERTFKRKLKEFAMSLILENHSSKDEILETYLNIIYLGQNGPFQIRGFPAAAEYYFGKHMQNLELGECALLAAVLNSPGLYDPFRKTENSKKRRNLVLDKMLEYQLINQNDLQSAKSMSMPQNPTLNLAETAPYYIDAVQKELSSLSVPISGSQIFTALDIEAQANAQKAVIEQLKKLEEENKLIKKIKEGGKTIEGVLMSANNATGFVEAIVGGRSYKLTQFNRATDGHRQIGSIMKPFVFLSALEQSGKNGKTYEPTTILNDSRFSYEYQNQKWSPENYGQKYYGQVPMYFALKNSLNCATASLGIETGLEHIVDLARAAGIESRLEGLPSVTLGAFELFPREVLQAYLTLANFGAKKRIQIIRYVTDLSGELKYKPTESAQQTLQVLPTAILVSMMKQTIQGGTARSITLNGFKYPAAGKTGTTSDNRDSWFAGFTPQLTTIVWVGYDDNTPHGLTGASGSVPIWTEFMKKQMQTYPSVDFNWPKELVKVTLQRPDDEPKEFDLYFKTAP